jgi:hypothetical protein
MDEDENDNGSTEEAEVDKDTTEADGEEMGGEETVEDGVN